MPPVHIPVNALTVIVPHTVTSNAVYAAPVRTTSMLTPTLPASQATANGEQTSQIPGSPIGGTIPKSSTTSDAIPTSEGNAGMKSSNEPSRTSLEQSDGNTDADQPSDKDSSTPVGTTSVSAHTSDFVQLGSTPIREIPATQSVGYALTTAPGVSASGINSVIPTVQDTLLSAGDSRMQGGTTLSIDPSGALVANGDRVTTATDHLITAASAITASLIPDGDAVIQGSTVHRESSMVLSGTTFAVGSREA